ncbi:nucleotide sugar dehydrogenase [Streptococcus hillyeri]|uniref:UDP-glucose 6-dehydrogenase n=1 Tax=Streptococcus hillyeri TaxID=2282420 RepID=A0A3L9DS71_9STRE|nr:nucleotide sugar dehydrogenase [Streptococcus hillyeri]RLY02439.1 UDP-glucose/GDP-mannose dehydrogenase family protein [Streptococcus hillyeri]
MSNILILGAGYVGLSHACVFSSKHKVTLVDNNLEKLELLKNKISPIKEIEIEDILQTTTNIHYTNKIELDNIDYIFICVPTNYTEKGLDTSIVENVVEELQTDIPIIIKSTIPIGFTSTLNRENIVFSPEFLREGQAVNDLLNPSRLIVGTNNKEIGEKVVHLYQTVIENDVPILMMGTKESETVKLFSNTYLAMRVAFFNIIDNYAIKENLNSKDVIEGISYDNRIGNYYNNPSFGFGGYCLPKDTHQTWLETNSDLISNILHENQVIRPSLLKEKIDKILKQDKSKIIGVYNYAMKKDSDNDRESSTYNLVRLLEKDYQIRNKSSKDSLEDFVDAVDLVIANRMTPELIPHKEKVFTRDIFNND